MTFDDVRAIALDLPEVVETTSYGTPSFKVRKQMLCRLRDDGVQDVHGVDVGLLILASLAPRHGLRHQGISARIG